MLQLYRVARNTSAQNFKDAVFEVVKGFLHYDSALWGTYVTMNEKLLVHSFHLYKQPQCMMQDYENVKQHDMLSVKANLHPGITQNVSIYNTKWKLHPDIIRFASKWNLHHALGTIWIDPLINICTAVSLYRNHRGRPFSESERRFKQILIPHLTEAWNFNAMLYVDYTSGPRQSYQTRCAVIDREGVVYNSESDFAELLLSEFPNWHGPRIPAILLDPLMGPGEGSYHGVAVVVSKLRNIEEGMFLIGVRPLSRIDHLTSRELAVSREFAAGKTYKEIANGLGVSPATVRNQLQSAYSKLGVNSKIELAKQLSNST